MKNIFDKLKNVFGSKKELSTKELYAQMDEILNQAEADIGGNFFPKEKLLSTEDVHYKSLRLEPGAGFDLIQEKYHKLKEKYNPELYKFDEEKYEKALELEARIEMAYLFFKNKFKIEE